ncbi:MAG: hypothetical protein IJK06_09085 [Clostridia bacterium]|nr:hypothetical protein [Clostridia bacterium]
MLSISTIARVIVNASRAVSVPTSFDTGLLLIKDSNFTAPKRLKTYDSAAAAIAGADLRRRGRPAPPESGSGDLSPGAGHPRL